MNAPADKFENGLADAVGCPPVSPMPGIGVGGLAVGNFTGLGVGAYGSDPTSSGATIFRNLRNYLVSNFRQLLSQAYEEIGLIQTIVDIPVDDALRGGVDIKSLELDEDEIEELRVAIERDGDLTVIGQGAKWARLYGGGATMVVSDQDPELPLDIATLDETDDVEFRAADMWELSDDGTSDSHTSADSEDSGKKLRHFQSEFYTYYGVKVHHSRVLRIKGKEPTSFNRPRLRGWGVSVVETLVRSINQYLKATDLSFEVLDEFKLDVYRFKDLVNTLLAPGGEAAIKQRVGIANWQKNYQNAVVLDAEDEYDSKQLSFAGLAEAMSGIRMQVAADMRIPLTKLFGMSSAGFNSGEDDIEVYNAMVESQVRNKIKPDILRVIEIKCQLLFGFVPDDLSITFKPLRVLSSTDEETVKTQKYTRLLQAKQSGEITAKEFRDACNKENLLGITLDTDDLTLTDVKDENAPAPAPEFGDDDSENDDEERTLNDFDESKHKRADDGKFGSGGGSAEMKAVRAKHPSLSGDDFHSKGDKDAATKQARELRAKGIHATVLHMSGPKRGPKSEYFVMVPETKKNTGFEIDKAVRTLNALGYDVALTSLTKKRKKKIRSKYYTAKGFHMLPKALSNGDRIKRAINSAAFDRASYAADGGDNWTDPRRAAFFKNPPPDQIDRDLWARGERASTDAFGVVNPLFVAWWYHKQGGTFE